MNKLFISILLFSFCSFAQSEKLINSVEVELIINEDGQVINVTLLKSSGNKESDDAAILIGKNKRFIPLIINGRKTSIKTNFSISFDASDGKILNIKDVNNDYYLTFKDLKIKSGPNPDDFYPSFSKRTNEQGVVLTEVYVDENGKVENVKIKKSSGFFRLDKATIGYLKAVTFDVPLINDKPVKVIAPFTMRFNLSNN